MIKTLTLTKIDINYLVKFILLLTVATSMPFLGFHSQLVTGSIVNAILILSVFTVGARGALLIGILPSTIALGSGLLPIILAPMIPFIIISNTILILIIDYFKKSTSDELQVTNYFFGLTIASGLKFLFLFFTSGIVINLLLNE